MNFTKRNNFIEAISLKAWQGTEGQKHYKNLISSGLYQTQVMLNSAFSEFKDEFQQNEILDKMDFVIERLNYDITGIIKGLEGYLENEKKFYTNTSKENTIEDEKRNQNLWLVKEIVLMQHQLAQKALEYININRRIPEIQGIKNNFTSITKSTNKNEIELDNKPVINLQKNETIRFFMALAAANIIKFKDRKSFENHLESNYRFKCGGNEKDITAVGTEISEMLSFGKDTIDKDELKKINSNKDKLFKRIYDLVKEKNIITEAGHNIWEYEPKLSIHVKNTWNNR